MKKLICQAIKAHKQLKFIYSNEERKVEPHMYGILGKDEQIHAYQINEGWKNFKVRNVTNLKMLKATFKTETTYNKSNAHYTNIFCSL